MQNNQSNTIEQEVCEVFGWSKPNVFVRLVVQAIERIQTGYETYPAGGHTTETPQTKAEIAAHLKTQLALLRQLKEAMQICALARKTFSYVQKQGQAAGSLNVPAAAPMPNKLATKGAILRIPDETSATTVLNTEHMMQMLPMSVLTGQVAKASTSELQTMSR